MTLSDQNQYSELHLIGDDQRSLFLGYCIKSVLMSIQVTVEHSIVPFFWTVPGPLLQLNHLQALIHSTTNVKMYGVEDRRL